MPATAAIATSPDAKMIVLFPIRSVLSLLSVKILFYVLHLRFLRQDVVQKSDKQAFVGLVGKNCLESRIVGQIDENLFFLLNCRVHKNLRFQLCGKGKKNYPFNEIMITQCYT